MDLLILSWKFVFYIYCCGVFIYCCSLFLQIVVACFVFRIVVACFYMFFVEFSSYCGADLLFFGFYDLDFMGGLFLNCCSLFFTCCCSLLSFA